MYVPQGAGPENTLQIYAKKGRCVPGYEPEQYAEQIVAQARAVPGSKTEAERVTVGSLAKGVTAAAARVTMPLPAGQARVALSWYVVPSGGSELWEIRYEGPKADFERHEQAFAASLRPLLAPPGGGR